mmetsp:Transcript_7682/g.13363  ORF Transcript_7682/g.13363 Transcript_7682/m.13363 type:complete len:302 (-) Transcript_7682:471-1376(-)
MPRRETLPRQGPPHPPRRHELPIPTKMLPPRTRLRLHRHGTRHRRTHPHHILGTCRPGRRRVHSLPLRPAQITFQSRGMFPIHGRTNLPERGRHTTISLGRMPDDASRRTGHVLAVAERERQGLAGTGHAYVLGRQRQEDRIGGWTGGHVLLQGSVIAASAARFGCRELGPFGAGGEREQRVHRKRAPRDSAGQADDRRIPLPSHGTAPSVSIHRRRQEQTPVEERGQHRRRVQALRRKDRRAEILLVERERGRVELRERALPHVGVQIHSGRDEGGVDEAEGAAEGADVEAEDGVAEGVF